LVLDALIRLIPGVLSDETSALTDSFQDGLLSGQSIHALLNTKDGKFGCINERQLCKIDKWREDMAYEHTKQRIY
jgi:tRNA (guanine37-N1)-methyltransferase